MRARNIKPGFASDKNLLKCSTPAHLLFPMLWMMADREGRLEDDPEQIALDSFFVVRGLDCDPLLAELADRKLITRYTVKGKNFIQINKFNSWIGRDMPGDWRETRLFVFERDGYVCGYCGEKISNPHCDHIIPHSLGGSNEPDNLVTACPSCNLSKHARTPEEWRDAQ